MLPTLVAGLAIGLTSVAQIAVFLGLGRLAFRALGFDDDPELLLVAPWMGFVAVLGLVQAAHLFVPARPAIWLMLAPLAALGLRGIRIPVVSKIGWALSAVGAVCVLWYASGPVLVHDTGIYHLSATAWANAFPVTPGLANLHGRLGFNASFFPYAATLSGGAWAGRPHHVAVAPLLLMAMAVSVRGVSDLCREGPMSARSVAGALLVVPFFLATRHYAASISPNGVVALLILVAVWAVVGARTEPDVQRAAGLATVAAVLSLAAVTVKLTAAPLAVALVLLVLRRIPRLGVFVGIAAVLLVPWVIRGVVLSGHPFYPMDLGRIELDWTVPLQQPGMELEWTRSFARRALDGPPQGFEWTTEWWRTARTRSLFGLVVPLVIGVAALPLLAWRGLTQRTSWSGKLVAVACVLFGALGVWFFSAPDPRFGGHMAWALAIVGVTALLQPWSPSPLLRRALAGGLALAIALLIQRGRKTHPYTPPNDPALGLIDRGLAPTPSPPLRAYRLKDGTQLQVPAIGNETWSDTLLITPHPSPGLRRRDPDELRAGFRHEGDWNPERFPSSTYPGFQSWVREQLR